MLWCYSSVWLKLNIDHIARLDNHQKSAKKELINQQNKINNNWK